MNATMLDKSYERVKDSLTPETAPGAQDGQPRVSNRSGGMVVRLGSRRAVVGRTQRAWLLGAHGVSTSQGIREWQERGILKNCMPGFLGCYGGLASWRSIWRSSIASMLELSMEAKRPGQAPWTEKKLSKPTVLVNQDGLPLVIHTAAANQSDQTQILPTACQFPEVRKQHGPPKQRPDELYADRAYDCDATRGILRWLGIRPKIARRGEEHGSGLAHVRWVVERTISWLKGLRRLRTRYDRLLQSQQAWNSLAAAVTCFRLGAEPVTV